MAVNVIAVQANRYPADTFRLVTSGMWSPGVIEGAAVTISSLAVTVAVGRVIVPGNRRQYQGNYEVVIDTAQTLNCATGGASQRIDLIVAKVYDHQEDSSGQNKGTVEIVAGTAGAGQPATPSQCLLLATVTVAAGASTGTVTPKATSALQLGGLSGVPTFTTVAERDSRWTSPPNGAVCVTLDTYTTWLRKNGVWQPPPGTIVNSGGGRAGDFLPNTGSQWDINSFTIAPVPYPTMMQASTTFWWGFSTFNVTCSQDLYLYATGTVYASPGDTVCPANTWCNQTLQTQWAVAANVDPSWKGRITPKNFGGGTNCWATAVSTWTQRAT